MIDKLRKGIRYILDADYRFLIDANFGKYDEMPDEEYLKRRYKSLLRKELDLDNPVSYNEKLQWLKLHDRNPLYTTMVDKSAAKDYVAEKIGKEYIIPTLGVWDRFDDIDFTILPNQFVLKCTHDSGGLVICKDKSTLDIVSAKKRIEKSLKRDYYLRGREWPYKNVPKRIIAEKYMEDDSGGLRDYKFYTFNGKTRLLMINTDRGTATKADYFDENFNRLDFRWGYPNSNRVIQKPKNFELMKELAERLAEDLLHVRVDFYECGGKVYFGELTFYDGDGFSAFDPAEWDLKLGEYLKLPIPEGNE